MKDSFDNVSRRITLLTVLVSILSVIVLALFLIQFNNNRSVDTSYSEIETLAANSSAVQDYLDEQKGNEPHFVTLAELVKEDQQRSINSALIYTSIPVIALAAVIGLAMSRYILRPVRQSYDSQERFIQDAAHELRNPLAAMTVALSNDEKHQANVLEVMQRQLKRLINITEDLLYLEKKDSQSNASLVDISELTNDVIEDLRPYINDSAVNFIDDVGAGVEIKISPKEYVTLAKNIIENAIKYTASGKDVKVSLSGDKGAILTVTDQGIGIPKEDLAHMGARFHRASNVGGIEGTGLGLSIVNKIADSYKAKVQIESQSEQGTKVQVTFR